MYLTFDGIEFGLRVSSHVGTPWIELVFYQEVPPNYRDFIEHALTIVRRDFCTRHLRDIYIKGSTSLFGLIVTTAGRLGRRAKLLYGDLPSVLSD